MNSQPPPGGGRLSEDVYRKLRAVEDGSSTLTAAGLQGLSARILHATEARDAQSGEIYVQQMVEIIKKPGQSLGLYLREGNGIDRGAGVFASRFGEGSELERYGDVIRPGDEILAVNNVEVSKMAIDDVVLILSIPRRLVLRLQFVKNRREMATTTSRPPTERPVVVFHRLEERKDDGGNILAQPTNTANTWLGKKARQQQQETMSRHATIQRPMPSVSTSTGQRSMYPPQTRAVNGYGEMAETSNMDTVARTARVPPPKIFSAAGPSQVRRTESFNSAPPSTFTMPRSTTAGPSDPLLSRSLCSPVLPRLLRDHKSNSLPRRRAISGPRNVKWRTDALLSDVYDDEGAVSAPEHGSPAFGTRPHQPYVRPYSSGSGRTVNDIFSAAEYRYWAGPVATPPTVQAGGRPSRWSHTYGESRGGPRSSSLPGRTLMAQSLVGSPVPQRHIPPQAQVLDRYHVSPLMNRRAPLRAVGPGIDVDRLTVNSLTGILFVQILEGKGLRLGERERERAEEMYCVLEVDEQHRARTGVTRDAHREGRYRWRETFHIDVYNAKLLQFYIYSWHPEYRHKLHFRGALRLLDKFIVDQLNGDHMFSLNLEPRGQVHVRVGFHDMFSVFRRACAPREGVFAVPLSRLISRERRDTPIALTRLIQEIERRGVDYNGIYVLCGAVEKKQLLREELEVNPLGAELSPDAMPDTNVLACLVKDFLRELPEPLIPLQIHAMLRDVAAVAPPNDMSASRDLVFRVLDCLPPHTRTSLLMVLDHLALLLQSAPHNGLSVAKLSVLFAPLLLCCAAPTQRDGLRPLDVTQAASTLHLLLDHWLSRNAEMAAAGGSTAAATTASAAARTPIRRAPPLRLRNLSAD